MVIYTPQKELQALIISHLRGILFNVEKNLCISFNPCFVFLSMLDKCPEVKN